MNEPTEAMKAMAENIATEVADRSVYKQGTDNYARVWQGARSGALAAIIETQEACAKVAEMAVSPDWPYAVPPRSRLVSTSPNRSAPATTTQRTRAMGTEATVTQALKPCPFCGGESWAINSPVSPSIAIMCRSCGATGGLRDTEDEAIAAWNTRTAASQASDAGEAAIAKIIDPDAWHETLPTDGCGVYWIGRRNKARDQANAIRQLLSDPNGVLENKAGGLWYRRWHAAQTRVNELEQQVALSPPTSGEEMRLRTINHEIRDDLIAAAPETVAFEDLIAWLSTVRHFSWTWTANTRCKYVDIRIDTRRGAFAILDRDGNKITLDELRHQHRAALTKGADRHD